LKIISRSILAIMLLAAAAILAFGPRPSASVPDGFTTVTYWEKWTAAEGSQMQQIVNRFNATVGQEKKIFVKYMAISQLDRKALISAAAGVPPDIAGMWDRHVVQFAARDAVEPLDELAREYGIDKDTYKPVFWNMCTWKGRLWALISTPAIIALHWNKHAFYDSAENLYAAGLDPTRPPLSIAEFDRYAECVDKRNPHTGRYLRVGHLPFEPNWYITVMPFWFGGRTWDSQRNQFLLTSEPVIRCYEWMQSYPRRLGRAAMNEYSTQQSFGSPTNPFIAGQVAMVIQGPWMANYTYNLRPAMSEVLVPKSIELLLPRVAREFNYEWAAEAFPADDPARKDVTFGQADVLMILKGARHKREAFEFMAFVQRQENMEQLCSMHCKLSPLAKVSNEFIRKHPNPYIEVFERLSRSPNACIAEMSPLNQEVGAELEVGIQRLYLNAIPPDDVSVRDVMRDTQNRLELKKRQYEERLKLRGDSPAEAGG
jgi:ABC-type glycerol-3-phosphate transport system substrate-binding protein